MHGFQKKRLPESSTALEIGTTEPMQSNRLGWTRASAFELRGIVRIIPSVFKILSENEHKPVQKCTLMYNLF